MDGDGREAVDASLLYRNHKWPVKRRIPNKTLHQLLNSANKVSPIGGYIVLNCTPAERPRDAAPIGFRITY
ncbi:hypothetical protein MJO29_006923 [Puccinia striiformis f. sp. tritici]|nr:hypothetical protein MJO29_006923 [Puccinia striiformis f. sp. tritici]